MTVQYPNTCVRSFAVNLPEDVPTFSDTLRSEGFATKAIGKMHVNFWFRKVYEEARSAEYIEQLLFEGIEQQSPYPKKQAMA